MQPVGEGLCGYELTELFERAAEILVCFIFGKSADVEVVSSEVCVDVELSLPVVSLSLIKFPDEGSSHWRLTLAVWILNHRGLLEGTPLVNLP